MLSAVADKKADVPKRATAGAKKLSMPSRVAAFVLGLAGLGAGGFAVFVTHLEARPVGLLAVGLIFMIVALAGTLPSRLKVGENEAAWEAEREAVEVFVERVAEATPVVNQREFLGALSDLAEDAPDVAVRGVTAFAYEQQIRTELEELARDLEPSFPDGQPVRFATQVISGGHEVDGVVEGPTGRQIAIEVKYSTERLAPVWIDLMYNKFFTKSGVSEDFAALLFITGTPLTPALEGRIEHYPQIRHVRYRGPQDQEALRRALREVLTG
jgi:hypothetical protein